MKKSLPLSFALLLAATSVQAAPITQGQARQRAERFLQHQLHRPVTASIVSRPLGNAAVFHAPAMQQEQAPFYVFNADNSYIIMSGDDQMPAILGYSLNESWPTDEALIPDALKAVLASYASEVEAIRKGLMPARPARELSDDPEIIVNAMIKTQWNQTYPFNKYAPGVGAFDKFNVNYQMHYPIGCAAVAFGQILNYWKAPQHPEDCEAYYTWQEWLNETDSIQHEGVGTLSSQTIYDYEHMPLTLKYSAELSGLSDEEFELQGEAVGTFLRDVAWALEMDWASGGGGSYDHQNIWAMVGRMGMSPEAQYLHASQFPGDIMSEEWWQLIQEDLDNGRPIRYSGADPSAGGHAFIFDGYDSNRFVHVNWGWGGMCDNWYDISILKTDLYDTQSGRIFNFSTRNGMVHNLHPRTEGEVLRPSANDLHYYGYVFNLGEQSLDLPLGFCAREHILTITDGLFDYMFNARPIYSYRTKFTADNGESYTQPMLEDADLFTLMRCDPAKVNAMLQLPTVADFTQLPEGHYVRSLEVKKQLGEESTDWLTPTNISDSLYLLNINIKDDEVILTAGNIAEQYGLYLAEESAVNIQTPDDYSMLHTVFTEDPKHITAGNPIDIYLIATLFLRGGNFVLPNPEGNSNLQITLSDNDGNVLEEEQMEFIDELLQAIALGYQVPSGDYALQFTIPFEEGTYDLCFNIEQLGFEVHHTLVVGNGTPTAIRNIGQKSDLRNASYDLMGRKHNRNTGLNIQGGRVVFVK